MSGAFRWAFARGELPIPGHSAGRDRGVGFSPTVKDKRRTRDRGTLVEAAGKHFSKIRASRAGLARRNEPSTETERIGCNVGAFAGGLFKAGVVR
jgi:hypothetical protein